MSGTGVAEGSNQGRQVGCCTNSQNTGIKPRVCDKACSPDFQEVPQAPLSQRDADCMHCPSILEGNHSVSAECQSTSKLIRINSTTFPFLGLFEFELSCPSSSSSCLKYKFSYRSLGSLARFLG